MLKLQPKLAWTQLMGKKEGIVIEFTNEEMEQYVHKLYIENIYWEWEIRKQREKNRKIYQCLLRSNLAHETIDYSNWMFTHDGEIGTPRQRQLESGGIYTQP